MKKIDNRIFTLLALVLGLGLGYLFFSGEKTKEEAMSESHSHNHEEEESVWTCSMHPQIRQNEAGICPICEMDLIVQDDNSGSGDPLVLQMTETAAKLAELETTIIGRGSSTNTLRLAGRMKADERTAVSQVAHIPGRIEKLYVSFTGEKVKYGQELAAIYSPQLINAQQELIQAAKLIDVNPNLVTAARNKLSHWNISQDQIRMIENRARIQETFIIKAEYSGVVTDKKIAVGDHINEGQILFDLIDLEKLWVLFDVYEEDLGKIKLNDRISFSSNAIPGRSFSTRITFIDPSIDPETRVATARGEIINYQNIFKPEMFVQGTLESPSRSGESLLLPASAVLWTGKRSLVYVKEPNTELPSYRYQEVTLGAKEGGMYRVEKGLEAGDEVVTHGNFVIDAAAQLNNQSSMMNKLASIKGKEGKSLPNFIALTPERFHQQLSGLLGTYLSLKDALVETNADRAKKEAQLMENRLDGMNTNIFQEEDQKELADYWSKQKDNLELHLQALIGAKDVEAQRKQFEFISNLMIEISQVYGTGKATFYVQHCPMAFDNKGADWISSEDAVLNPYFGDIMLRCGVVKGELP